MIIVGGSNFPSPSQKRKSLLRPRPRLAKGKRRRLSTSGRLGKVELDSTRKNVGRREGRQVKKEPLLRMLSRKKGTNWSDQ
jgi:hypothetical protein